MENWQLANEFSVSKVNCDGNTSLYGKKSWIFSYFLKINNVLVKNFALENQGSFISQMEWALFKSLFWKTNDSIAKLKISFTSGVSLWDRPCY